MYWYALVPILYTGLVTVFWDAYVILVTGLLIPDAGSDVTKFAAVSEPTTGLSQPFDSTVPEFSDFKSIFCFRLVAYEKKRGGNRRSYVFYLSILAS